MLFYSDVMKKWALPFPGADKAVVSVNGGRRGREEMEGEGGGGGRGADRGAGEDERVGRGVDRGRGGRLGVERRRRRQIRYVSLSLSICRFIEV